MYQYAFGCQSLTWVYNANDFALIFKFILHAIALSLQSTQVLCGSIASFTYLFIYFTHKNLNIKAKPKPCQKPKRTGGVSKEI